MNFDVVSACRGKDGGCRHALAAVDRLIEAINPVLHDSGIVNHIRETTTGKLLAHHRFKVVVAACPNACSQPQIRDFGIIIEEVPQGSMSADLCTQCGICVDICREDAIHLDDTGPEFDRGACVNCGCCIRSCPTNAIITGGLQYRVLVGGRLGRHPHLAEELLVLRREEEILKALQVCLERFVSDGRRDERFAAFVVRTGIDELRHAVEQGLENSD